MVDAQTASTIHNILTYFTRISGHKINMAKSKIFFAPHTDLSTHNRVVTTLGIDATTNLGTYLGFPLTHHKLNASAFRFVLDKLQTKLNAWEHKFLTLAGRATLIKATLSALPTHIMQIFKLPESSLQQIDRISRNFLWGSMTTKRKIHPVKWDQVCQPLDHGGIGLAKAKNRNIALLMNLAWTFHSNSQSLLWANLLLSKYQNKKQTSPSSLIWKSIQLGWTYCQLGITYQIGSGKGVFFWTDVWTETSPLRSSVYGPLPEHELTKRVSSYITAGSWHLHDLPFDCLTPFLYQIRSVILPMEEYEDKFFWRFTNTGTFSTKSAYKSYYIHQIVPLSLLGTGSRNIAKYLQN